MKTTRFAGTLDARRTAADVVAEALRDAILGGELKDGERLNQAEIADEFEISRVPVREAIGRLQAEGLVSAEPHRKAIVIGFDQHRMAEVFEIRRYSSPTRSPPRRPTSMPAPSPASGRSASSPSAVTTPRNGSTSTPSSTASCSPPPTRGSPFR